MSIYYMNQYNFIVDSNSSGQVRIRNAMTIWRPSRKTSGRAKASSRMRSKPTQAGPFQADAVKERSGVRTRS